MKLQIDTQANALLTELQASNSAVEGRSPGDATMSASGNGSLAPLKDPVNIYHLQRKACRASSNFAAVSSLTGFLNDFVETKYNRACAERTMTERYQVLRL